MTGSGPLHGVRVVELAMWVAGPAAGGIMADWGADVIKVESPAGDPQRALFSAGGLDPSLPVPPFEIDNRGKRSVVLDLGDPADRELFDELLADADVFVTNLRLGALERLGLDPDTLCARLPRLVYGSITGYGATGPDRDRAGYDIGAFWARSGLAHTSVPPGTTPSGLHSGMGDHTTGMTLVAGIMAKLFERDRTGRGGVAATSLLRAGMYAMSWDFGIQLRFDRRSSTRDRRHSLSPLTNNYPTADGRAFWLLLLEPDRHWPTLIDAIERPDLAADPRFADQRARVANSVELVAELDEVFTTRTLAEWGERFDRCGVWWSPALSIAEVIADPQAQPGFVDMSPREGDAPFRAVATPIDFDGHELRPGPVPRLGEHTDEIRDQVRGDTRDR